jgi:hypothetical protein
MLDPDPDPNPDPQHSGHTIQKVVEFIIKIRTTKRRSLLPRVAPHADVLPQAAEHDELRPARHQAVQNRLLWRFRTYKKQDCSNTQLQKYGSGTPPASVTLLFPTMVPTKGKEPLPLD